MDEGVEGGDAAPGASPHGQGQYVAQVKGNVEVQLPGVRHHAWRQVHAQGQCAVVVQIARHLARPAAQVADGSETVSTLGEAVKLRPVEGLVAQLVVDAGRVFGRDSIIALSGVVDVRLGSAD